jgi:hypothetical protein
MTTATAAHRRQLLLPGQAAAQEGPVDLSIMYAVHHAFRRDLAAFAAAAGRTPADDRPTWRALAQRWELFATTLHGHHSGEDAGLWPMLLDRVDAAGDAEGRQVLEAMEAEHADIDPLLHACGQGFARLAASADEDARAALAVRLVAAREHLARHLRHEECDALRLVQAHLSQADWDRMDKEHFQAEHTFADLLRLAPWVLHGLPTTAVERLKATRDGRVLVALWKLLLRRRFERRERVAFRYVGQVAG